tara:strand:- start:6140 stop:7108 length:969 start_codon:yes stop_codon:yes gene_type:complete
VTNRIFILFLITLTPLAIEAKDNPFTHATPITPHTVNALKLKTFHLEYIDTQSVLDIIQQPNSAWISSSAKISHSAQNHTLWIEDDSSHLVKIQQLISTIDKPTPQIRIDAQLISLNHHTGESLGAQYGTHSGTQHPQTKPNTFLIPLFTLADNTQFNMQLQALMEHGEANLLAKPELITLNRHTATIESGQEIPYQQATSSGGTSVTFKDAALKLEVTPILLPHQRIQLNLKLNQDTVSSLKIAGAPAITTQQLQTQLLLNNHQTLALGGITTSQQTHQFNSIPFLHAIPILGRLFKDQQKSHQHDELLIVLTPHIEFRPE